MKYRKDKMERVDINFVNKTNKLKGFRMQHGLDKKPISMQRITAAMANEPEFDLLITKLSTRKRKEDLF